MNQMTISAQICVGGEGALYVRDLFGEYRAASEEDVRAAALRAVASQVRSGPVFDSPATVKDYLVLQLAHLEHEVFAILFLDSQHRLIQYREMFRGTVNQTSVYPREVVKAALACNASAILCAHNHPSGQAEPSRADEYLTQTLKSALMLVDIRVLDHIVVGGHTTVSMAQRGLI